MPSFLTKILLTAGILSGSFFSGTAQIQVGSAELPVMNAAGRLTDEMLQKLKGTTTLFVLLDRDYEQLDAYQQAIGKVWKYTPFKIIRREEIGDYLEEGKYSFGMLGGYITTSRNSQTTHLTYDLGMLRFNRKGEIKGMDYFSRMVLSPDAKTMFAITASTAGLGGHGGIMGPRTSKQTKREGMDALYAEGVFYDWSPGFLMGKLQFVNTKLADGETMGSFSELTNREALAGLRRDTLFIPDYVNIKYSPYGGTEREQETDEDDLKESYPYKVQYVSTEVLNDRILNSSKPIYYLVNTVSSTDKYVNIYHTQAGRLYAEYTPLSYKFKLKDLKKIAKLIKD